MFLHFHPQYKNKTNLEIRLKKSYFSIEIDLAIRLEQWSLQENPSLDAAQHLRSYSPWRLHEDAFSGSDALIRAVWIKILASEAGAVSAADPPGCHGLTCPRALAHRILDPVSSPIQQWNRENISNAMIIVRQSVSESRSPWYGQSDKPFFSYWNLTGIHALNTMTIMYGPYRHRGHVGAFDHASIAVNNRPGIQRDSLHILYFARKSPQTAAPSPMYSPDIKEQMLQRKIKSETSNFFTRIIITKLKVFKMPHLYQCTLPTSRNS